MTTTLLSTLYSNVTSVILCQAYDCTATDNVQRYDPYHDIFNEKRKKGKNGFMSSSSSPSRSNDRVDSPASLNLKARYRQKQTVIRLSPAGTANAPGAVKTIRLKRTKLEENTRRGSISSSGFSDSSNSQDSDSDYNTSSESNFEASSNAYYTNSNAYYTSSNFETSSAQSESTESGRSSERSMIDSESETDESGFTSGFVSSD